ncbi:chromosome condensation protein [Burkholderia savannae]|uniref:Chromosome condensation protein n=1 Tax=Burkholderia savannae TaxID=1637837 RepID=A0ABR5T8T3_9BURK|nr:chromosome condensation protein [Burkholderia savannae]
MTDLLDRLRSVDDFQAELLFPEQEFLLRIHAVSSPPAIAWVMKHHQLLREALLRYGVVLIRGLDCDRKAFGSIAELLEPSEFDYTAGSGPHTSVDANVFSIDVPGSMALPQHNEMAYNFYWPMHVLFFCEQPPAAGTGGATSVCDSRQFLRDMAPSILEPFLKYGIRYVRNFPKHMPYKSIEDTFGTSDRTRVNEICAERKIEPIWISDDHLQIRQHATAVRRHPITREESFFSSVCVCHPASWWDLVKRAYPDAPPPRSQDEIWQTALYGNGAPIPDDVIRHLLQAYEKREYHVEWKKSDILYIDNMRASHGRRACIGARTILGSFRTSMTMAQLDSHNS